MLVRVMPELIGSVAAYLLISRISERRQASSDASKEADEAKDKENLLKVHLAEYDNLRKEIFERLRAQQGAFNLLVAILAAIVTATGYVIQNASDLLPALTLLLPLFTVVPGFIFFNDEPVLFALGHSVGHVRTRISRIIDSRREDILSDNVILHLNEHESLSHFLMACGRWIVFILPVFLPTACALYLYIPQHRFFSRPELSLLEAIALPLLIIDGMMLASLLFSIMMAVRNQVKWWRNLFIGAIGN